MINWKRVAIIVPVGAMLNMFLLFGLFTNPYSQQIIFSEDFGQSSKLVGVWKTIQPVPTLESLIPALIVTPAVYSFLFAVLYDSIPGNGRIAKGVFYGVILWALIAVFFELFVPNGLFGEPVLLLAYELFLWLISLVSVSIVISLIYKKQT